MDLNDAHVKKFYRQIFISLSLQLADHIYLTMNPFRKIPCLIFLLVILIAGQSGLSAKHIIGGEVTYVCTQTDGFGGGFARYNFKAVIYRDVFGETNFDNPARFGIFRQVPGNPDKWTCIDSIDIFYANRDYIALTNDPCVKPPPNILADKAEYTFSRTLRILPQESYIIAYQRCCRNYTINNIEYADRTGAAFMVEITPYAQLTGNSSPVFKGFPPAVICAGIDFNYDHSATDADGDSLVYSYFNPFHAGGRRGDPSLPGSPLACDGVTPSVTNCTPPFDFIQYAEPYSFHTPLGGAPIVTINRFTGLIKGVPNVLGQFAVGVKVDEYRNGLLIGTVYRDFQFNVTNCEPKVFAEIEYDEMLGFKRYLVNFCATKQAELINVSEERASIFSTRWAVNIHGNIVNFDTWNASVDFPDFGTYKAKLYLNESTFCADSADITINLFPGVEADFSYQYDTCVAGPVTLFDQSDAGSETIKLWQWQVGPDKFYYGKNTQHFFATPGEKPVMLIIEDSNLCRDSIEKIVSWFPAPALIVVDPSQFTACTPAGIRFTNLSVPIDETYDITWDFGDGNKSTDIHPEHTYTQAGNYTISLEIISPIGCKISKTFPDWIKIKEGPLADFEFSPEFPSILDNEVSFFDRSTGANSWNWSFGDGTMAFVPSPQHTYADSGVYVVQLIVTHLNNCQDTVGKTIDIQPLIFYHLPNAFTPDGDGNNDVFGGIGATSVQDFRSFRLAIYSRWGNLIFESNDPGTGWNGQLSNSGELLPQDVYVYLLTYEDARGNSVSKNGFVTLVR